MAPPSYSFQITREPGSRDACRYEPDLNRTYHEMAQHYGIAVMPARPRKPRDKARVENEVGIVERWIAHWHEQIGDPTIADSILYRLVHNAFRIELGGESMRKQRGKKPEESAA